MRRSNSRLLRNLMKLPCILLINFVWVHAFRPFSTTTTSRPLKVYEGKDFYSRILNPGVQHLQATIDSSSPTETTSTPIDISHDVDISAYRIHATNLTDDELFRKFEEDTDVPRLTENGGYTHTKASKAKISQANKGKTPWNKGKQRPDDVKARIAAGVRAKNRERFLEKLTSMGLTEEEYSEQKKRDRAAKDKERRERRTENGGYRHTPETKQKISTILKEKYASGEIEGKRNVDPSRVRRGFVHSEETRAKISASLKKRWSDDPEYRATMLAKTMAGNSQEHVRKKISDTLKRKWQDDEFRSSMLEKMNSVHHRDTHRERISTAMKAKWQDADYRKRTLEAISKQRREAADERGVLLPPPRQRRGSSTPAARPAVPKSSVPAAATMSSETLRQLRPRGLGETEMIRAVPQKKSKVKPTPATAVRPATERRVAAAPRKVSVKLNDDDDDIEEEEFEFSTNGDSHVNGSDTSPKQPKKKTTKPKSGDKDQLREDRRDLYDFLYGDEEGSRSNLASVFALGDENLDDFDPYGLEDF